jgi:hypothetical protein
MGFGRQTGPQPILRTQNGLAMAEEGKPQVTQQQQQIQPKGPLAVPSR